MTYGLGSQVFSQADVNIGDVGVQFVYDGAKISVEEDTVDVSNNVPMPIKLFIQRDGNIVPINKDSVTQTNTVGVPVEIVQASGTEINITAGDINVQTSHTGANPDSVRVGDGTNEMAVSADLEAQTHDPKVLAAFTAGQLARAGALGVTLSTEDQATQDAILAGMTAGQALSAASQPVVLSTEQEAILSSISLSSTPLNTKAAIYHNAATTTIDTIGVVVGVLAAAGREIAIQNNADAVEVSVNGSVICASLPGQTIILKSETTAGNISLRSLTGADILGGDFSINIVGV